MVELVERLKTMEVEYDKEKNAENIVLNVYKVYMHLEYV